MVSQVTLICLIVLTTLYTASGQFQPSPYNPVYPPKNENRLYNPSQQPTRIREPFLPSQNSGPRMRFRRDVGVGGKLTSNPQGGADALLQAQARAGSDAHNLAATAFAAGNTNGKGPTVSGASVGYNVDGHGLSISKTNIPGVGEVTSQNARVNLFDNGAHKFDANAFKATTQLDNGFEFTRRGGNVDYTNINGHGATLGMSSIPNLGTTYEAAAKANLWRSQDRMTSVDWMGSASRTSGGPFDGRKDYGTSVGITHMFG